MCVVALASGKQRLIYYSFSLRIKTKLQPLDKKDAERKKTAEFKTSLEGRGINVIRIQLRNGRMGFGVVLLEIACGKKAIHHHELKGELSLVEWVWELYGLRNITTAVDTMLYGQFHVKE
ncbi:unnamed protein product [Trifolium pratense]|uniref:Uncharacterized protein n=1 Tax=Trifolium pratense TaxID=57577 RepID=A0ACB0JMX2_TRIPR|nr:unnamed protein product [Trifolium pratense]